MSLVFLFAILLYLALVIALPFIGYRFAAGIGWPPRKRKWAAAVGFLIVFLPVFWDWLPTTWAFSHSCEKYAGVTVIKTPEQWKRENPGVAQTLVRQSPPLQVGSGDSRYLQLNQRFRWQTKSSETVLTIVQVEQSVIDSQSGEALVRFVDFATRRSIRDVRSLRDIKIWLNRDSCAPNGSSAGEEFGRLLKTFENLGADK